MVLRAGISGEALRKYSIHSLHPLIGDDKRDEQRIFAVKDCGTA